MSNRNIFRIVFVAFTLLMIGIGIHMCSRTTSPWNKEKIEQKYKVK